MRRSAVSAALILLLTAPQPAPAQAPERPVPEDIFAHLAANRWAFPNVQDMQCDENPHSVSFDADRTRASFDWQGPMINYLGEVDQQGTYDVIDSDATSITMYLHGEARRTEDGRPVIWILRLIEGGDAYCWDRTDWDPPRCTHLHVRCEPPAPIS